MTDELETQEHGYRPSSIVLAGTTTTPLETAGLLGVSDVPERSIDVVLLINPANNIEYAHFLFSGITETVDFSSISRVEDTLTTVDVEKTAEDGLYPLADIGYEIIFELMSQLNNDEDPEITVSPDTLSTDFEETLAETGVLLALNEYSLP